MFQGFACTSFRSIQANVELERQRRETERNLRAEKDLTAQLKRNIQQLRRQNQRTMGHLVGRIVEDARKPPTPITPSNMDETLGDFDANVGDLDVNLWDFDATLWDMDTTLGMMNDFNYGICHGMTISKCAFSKNQIMNQSNQSLNQSMNRSNLFCSINFQKKKKNSKVVLHHFCSDFVLTYFLLSCNFSI